MSTVLNPWHHALKAFGVGPLARYERDPVAFAHDCIRWPAGQGLAPYQEEILANLVEHRRAAVRGPHGLGKTTDAALAILWFALTRDGRDWKVPTTASAWRQLTEYLWPEVHKWARLLRWDKLGRGPFSERSELLDLSLRLSTGSAFALTSDAPASLEGAHAEHLLYVFDEAKVIPAAIFDAAEGAFSGAGSDTVREALALAISTPGEPAGRFYEIHARKAGTEDWWVRHVTLEECIAAGRVSGEWATQRERQWGEVSAVYANRVLGNFASSDEDAVVPLAWIEAANERWRAWAETAPTPRPRNLAAVGVDVARSGDDQTVLAPRIGDVITELRRTHLEDTTQTTSRVQALLRAQPAARVVVDVIGIGAGVFDQLRALKADGAPELTGVMVDAFNASNRVERRDRSGEFGFVNARAAAWWGMREALDPAFGSQVALPPDDELTGELTSSRWWVASGARIQVESKDEARKRLGRSTDAADAVIQAFWFQAGDMFAAASWGAPLVALPHDALVEAGGMWVRRWHVADGDAATALSGVLLAMSADGRCYVVDARRVRGSPSDVTAFLRATFTEDAARWRCHNVCMARPRGDAGRVAAAEWARALPDADFGGRAETGDDDVRAQPWANAVGEGRVRLLAGAWNADYLDDHLAYPNVASAFVDASALAYLDLAAGAGVGTGTRFTPRARHRR